MASCDGWELVGAAQYRGVRAMERSVKDEV